MDNQERDFGQSTDQPSTGSSDQNQPWQTPSQPAPSFPPPPPPPPPQPAFEPPSNDKGANWVGLVVVVVIIAVILYFAGFWGWLGSQLKTDQPAEQPTEQTAGGEVKQKTPPGGGETQPAGGAALSALPNKAATSIVITAGVTDGAVIVSGQPQPTTEIRKVFLHNPYRDNWLLVYDGVRPLDLKQLSATGEKHELLATNLLAIDYDKVRIQFVDLLQRAGQPVPRERFVDLAGVVIKEGQKNTIGIHFDISDPFQPIPQIRG